MEEDKKHMWEAIRLSREHMQNGAGGPFGAVIVKDNKVIGTGWNCVTSTNDPTAHAEVVAIREACKTIGNFSLEDATIYTSCEPCPMCLAAIYWARIKKIYYSNTREDAAKIHFDDDFLYREISKGIKHRKVPMQQLLHDEALQVFNEWQNKKDKIHY